MRDETLQSFQIMRWVHIDAFLAFSPQITIMTGIFPSPTFHSLSSFIFQVFLWKYPSKKSPCHAIVLKKEGINQDSYFELLFPTAFAPEAPILDHIKKIGSDKISTDFNQNLNGFCGLHFKVDKRERERNGKFEWHLVRFDHVYFGVQWFSFFNLPALRHTGTMTLFFFFFRFSMLFFFCLTNTQPCTFPDTM